MVKKKFEIPISKEEYVAMNLYGYKEYVFYNHVLKILNLKYEVIKEDTLKTFLYKFSESFDKLRRDSKNWYEMSLKIGFQNGLLKSLFKDLFPMITEMGLLEDISLEESILTSDKRNPQQINNDWMYLLKKKVNLN